MRKTFALILLTALIAACGGTGPTASVDPTPAPSPNPSAQPSPQPSPVPGNFYLRAWYTQALPPVHTFSWLPVLTIQDGLVIDGNVAVPAIFPGPFLIVPIARPISDAGITTIVDEARRLGLLGDVTDFTGNGPMPGSRLGQLQLVVDGVTYNLTGNPDTPVGGDAEVGSAEAFAAFWQELSFLDGWIGGELGQNIQYRPERVALLFTAPAQPEPGLEQQLVTWPLPGSFETIGAEFPGEPGARCVTLAGEDLDATLPQLLGANQLTVFHDEVDGQRSALAVVVVPGADSPCPDEG